MDRSVGSPWTRSVVGVRGPGVSVFGLPHVRYINPWLRDFRGKIVIFLASFVSQLDTKKTAPNLEVCSESLGAMFEY